MIFRLPFKHAFPSIYKYPTYRKNINNISHSYKDSLVPTSSKSIAVIPNTHDINQYKAVDTKRISDNNIVKKNEPNNSGVLELFGFKLDIDDLLILGILYFLYSENVNDQMLYIVLILLLLN